MASRSSWEIDERKYLTPRETAQLRTAAFQAAAVGSPDAVRAWLLVDLILSTGLRVAELAALRLGDLMFEGGRQSLVVRRGKGGKRRTVLVGPEIIGHVTSYLAWRRREGPTGPDAYLLWSARGRGGFSRRYLQILFKSTAEAAGLASHFSIHCLRHTYAVRLYKASNHNLRLVQKQLGHSSVQVTQVYADVLDEDAASAVLNLYPPLEAA